MADKVNVAVVGYGLAGNYFHSYPISIADGLNLYGVMGRRAEAREQAGADWGSSSCRTSWASARCTWTPARAAAS